MERYNNTDILTTESVIFEKKEEKAEPAMDMGMGMGF